MKVNELIFHAVSSNDPAQQREAERLVTQLRLENPQAFLCQCAAIIANGSENQVVRQSAAAVLSRSVGLKIPQASPQQRMPLWDCVAPPKKQQIKQQLISALVDKCDKTRRTASNAIASIASIEIQRGEWLDLIDTLNKNTQNSDPIFRKTAVTILGFICEKLKDSNCKVEASIQKSLLTGILSGSKNAMDANILQEAVRALRNALPFLGGLVVQRSVTEYILKELTDNIKSSQEEIRQVSIEALMELSKVAFDNLGPYLQAILAVTQPLLQTVCPETIVALQLWDEIGQEYLERKARAKRVANSVPAANHLLEVHERLVQHVLSLLVLVELTSENELCEAAVRTMSTIADCCGSIVFPMVTAFVSNCILSSEWKLRQASVIAFSTLSECADKKTVQELLANALGSFMNLLDDQNKFVLESTLTGFCRIFEFHANVFLQSPHYDMYMTKLTALLQQNSHIAELSLQVIRSITDCLSSTSTSPESCALSRNVYPLLNTITGFAFNSQKIDDTNNYFKVIMNLLTCCKMPDVACRYIEFLIGKFQAITLRNEVSTNLRSNILSSMFTCLLVLQHCVLNEQLLNSLLALVIGYFQSMKEVNPEGLYVMSGLSIVFKRAFSKVVDQVWPYIVHGLSKTDEPAVVKVALNCISDISRSITVDFQPKFEETMNILVKAMGSDIGRDLKLVIFSCLSDCFIAVGRDKAQMYLKPALDMVDLGLQGAIALSENPDEFEYAENLKQAATQLYQCINYAMSLNTSSISPMLQSHFLVVVPLIMQSCAHRFNPTIQYLATCVEILTDTAYNLQMTSCVNTQEMRNLVGTLREHLKNDTRHRQIVEYADRMIFNSR